MDSNIPAISAVIAVYNGGQHLREALESVRIQSLPPKDLVVIDDGSVDNSEHVFNQWINEFKEEITFEANYYRQENQGQGVARNNGVEASNGQFVAFLDQDDIWHEQHLETLFRNFENSPTLGWTYSDFFRIDGQSRQLVIDFLGNSEEFKLPAKTIFGMLGQDLMMLPSAALIRREAFRAVGGFDSIFRGYEDDDLFVRLFLNKWDFEFLPVSTVYYRVHSNNSSGGLSFPQSRWKFFQKYLNFLDDPELNELLLHRYLGRRIRNSLIIDIAAADRTNRTDARKLAMQQLKDIDKILGNFWRLRIVRLIASNKHSLSMALSIRRKFKKKNSQH